MADSARDELLGTFKDLFVSGKYSDFTITCGSDTFKVHKMILCSRSGFFERAERFPVGKEAATNHIDLPEDEPAAIKLFLHYIYEGEYEPRLPQNASSSRAPVAVGPRYPRYHYKFPHTCAPACPPPQHLVCPHHECGIHCLGLCVKFVCDLCCPNINHPCPPGGPAQLLSHSELYTIGDKYDVKGLKTLAREKFNRACAEYWDSEDFVAAARHAFEGTPDEDAGLRDTVIKTIAEHMVLLNKPEVEELLAESNGLALGVLKRRAGDLGWLRKEG